MNSNKESLTLWDEYASSGKSSVREQLIMEYSYIVKFVAGRLSVYFGMNVDYDDLVGYGILGLIDAIDRYDVSKGVKFETYASVRIRGAIIDNVRNMDWIPRSLRQKGKTIERVYWELESELGHAATEKQVADRLGMSLERFNKLVRDINLSTVMSLDDILEKNFDSKMNGTSISKAEKPEGYMELVEVREVLGKAIGKLPDKERRVITLYYYECLTLKEISIIMGVSESRISQLHTKAITRLNLKLAKDKKVLLS